VLTERVELTLSHVGLGAMTEVAMMTLFANAQAHALTAGTGLKLGDISDVDGSALYPGYYHTRVRLPPFTPLSRLGAWDEVSVGVEVKTFGRMMLESSYVLALPGGVPPDPAQWGASGLPTMNGHSLFVVDGVAGAPKVSTPREGALAQLEKLEHRPEAVDRFRKIQASAVGQWLPSRPIRSSAPLRYRLFPGRDAPPGRGVLFAKFTEIMDCAEHELLSTRLDPPFPSPWVAGARVVERDVYYLRNCRADDTLEIAIEGDLAPCPESLLPREHPPLAAALLRLSFRLMEERTRDLIALGDVTKVLAAPAQQQPSAQAVEDLLLAYHPGR
jgi:probable biosynthetic protein (TIGR04098 family)